MSSKATYIGGAFAVAGLLYYYSQSKSGDDDGNGGGDDGSGGYNPPTKENPGGGNSQLPPSNPTDPGSHQVPVLPPSANDSYQTSIKDYPRTGFCAVNVTSRFDLPGSLNIFAAAWAPEMAQYNTLADCLGRAEVRKATEKYRPVWEPIMDDHGDFNPWYDNPAKVCANPNMRQDGSCEWQTSSVIWVTPNPYPNGDPSPGYFQPPPKYDDHQGCYWYSESTGKVVHTWCPTIVPMGTPDEWKKDRTDINLDTNMWEQFGKKWFDH